MSYKVITAAKMAEMIATENVVVLDMRDSKAFLEGHIEGAIQATEEHVVKVVEETPDDSPVLVYCYYGVSSRKLAEYLVSQGLNNVYSLDGGWGTWCLMSR